MDLSNEQKKEVIAQLLGELSVGYFRLQCTAKACRDSGDEPQAVTISKQMEGLLMREESLKKQLSQLQ